MKTRFGSLHVLGLVALALTVVTCKGDTGSQGPAGPTGPTGLTGPQGPLDPPSSILTFDGAFSGDVPGVGTFLFACRTPSYTAGTGEVALIWTHASVSAPAGVGLGVLVGVSINGGADATIGGFHFVTNTGAGAANIANAQFLALGLTAGSSYTFTTALTNSDNATAYTASNGFCHTMAAILK